MNIKRKNNENIFAIEGLTFGKLLRLQKALELDQKETGSTLGAEMLQMINNTINEINSTPIKTN